MTRQQLLHVALSEMQIHDTADDSELDIENRLEVIKRLQRAVHAKDPTLDFTVLHLALLLQLRRISLQSLELYEVLDIGRHTNGFMTGCLRILPHAIDNTKPLATNAYDAIRAVMVIVNRRLWCSIYGLLSCEDDHERQVLSKCHDLYNIVSMKSGLLGHAIKPIRDYFKPHETNPEVVYICVEWRALPTQLAKAFGNDGESIPHLKGTPSEDLKTCKRKVDVESEGLAALLEQFVQGPDVHEDLFYDMFPAIGDCEAVHLVAVHLEPSSRIESGMRFWIPALKQDANETWRLLKLMWFVLSVAGMSAAADAMDELSDEPDPDWNEAYYNVLQERVDDEAARLAAQEKADKERARTGVDDDYDYDFRPDPAWNAAYWELIQKEIDEYRSQAGKVEKAEEE
ncbi:hypothetical protein F5X68DRAFT_261475 [Plectosphaerella plurivora]|uniref:Uncharacterized protein n=1 Tax=Plectosphaerella plurivora TaxID=936078 RepID=A0A9P9A8J1_9PEZI|nr:hypothetical protein F5X68DRAFT_261475 [Plectosphaerella plurivora]